MHGLEKAGAGERGRFLSGAAALMPVAEIAAVVVALLVAAQVRIPLPFTPVPITLQTLVVLAVPFLVPFWRATLGIALYALLGGMGAGIGVAFFASITGATWGYIIGFLAVPAIVAMFPRRPLFVPMAMGAALVAIYLFGTLWLAWWLGFSVYAAWMLGAVPFIPGDAVKLAIAAWLVIRLGAASGEKRAEPLP